MYHHDGEEERLTPEEEIEKLKVRIDEARAVIKAIEHNLREDGYDIKETSAVISRIPQSGIRIGNKLSSRGLEMAEEHFKMYDEDGDGWLSLLDFRTLLTRQRGRLLVHDFKYSNVEAWRMYMSEKGFPIDARGFMNVKSYQEYRKTVELKYPLASELSDLGIGFLPPDLKRWGLMKVLIKERLSLHPQVDLETRLTLDDAEYILSCSGLCYAREELFAQMIVRAKFEKVAENIVRNNYRMGYVEDPHRYAKVLLGTESMKSSPITKEFIATVKPDTLVALAFSRHEPPSYCNLYQYCLKCKFEVQRMISLVSAQLCTLYDVGLHLKERMVYRDFVPALLATMTYKSTVNFNVRIGDEAASEEEGTTVSWRLIRVENPDMFLMSRHFPRDCGFYISLDLMLRSEVETLDVEAACQSLKVLIMKHLDSQLKTSSFFKVLNVVPAVSDIDGAKVMRIFAVFNRQFSIDNFLERIYIPFTVCDLFEFNGEMKINQHMLDLAKSAHSIALDLMAAAKMDVSFIFKRDLILYILKRAATALSAGVSESSLTPKTPGQDVYIDKWLHLRPLFPVFVDLIKKAIKLISGAKSVGCMFKFPNFSDFFRKIGTGNQFFRRHFPENMGTEPGYVPKLIARMFGTFQEEVLKIFSMVKGRMEDKIEVEREHRTHRLINMSAAEKADASTSGGSSNALDIKLKSLGLGDMNSDDFLNQALEETDKTPAEFLEAELNLQNNFDARTLEMYEKMYKVVLGFHSIELFLGKSRLYAIGQGVDFMEIFPKPPSILAAQQEIQRKEEEIKNMKTKTW